MRAAFAHHIDRVLGFAPGTPIMPATSLDMDELPARTAAAADTHQRNLTAFTRPTGRVCQRRRGCAVSDIDGWCSECRAFIRQPRDRAVI